MFINLHTEEYNDWYMTISKKIGFSIYDGGTFKVYNFLCFSVHHIWDYEG